jgi:hypothetical protein
MYLFCIEIGGYIKTTIVFLIIKSSIFISI